MLGMLGQWPKWPDAQHPQAARPFLLPFVPYNGGTALHSLHGTLHALSVLQQTPGDGGAWPHLTVGKLGSDGAQLPGHRAFN